MSRRLYTRGTAAALAIVAFAACDDAGGDENQNDQDGSTRGQEPPEDSGTTVPSPGSGGSSSPNASFDASLPMFTLPSGKVCALEVGAQCDGPEDCATGETCCGTYDPLMLTYTRIGCSASCAAPNLYPFCHGSDECAEGLVCRLSRILPHEFVAVCAPPPDVPAEQARSAIQGQVTCGETTCQVGAEHCCLAAEFVFQEMMSVARPPYCAPLDVPCTCDGPPEVDAGMDSPDAG